MGLGNLSNYIDENWHGGQIKGDFFNHPEMSLEENLTVEKKPKTKIWNWKHAITRELMRGRHKAEIMSKYQDIMDRFGLTDKIREFLDKYDGFLGWFIVDVSNFDEKFGYDDMPEDMRKCNLYAYNATELREIISRSLVSENDGTMDGFLNSDENIHEDVKYVDDYTGLPCVDDIDAIFDDDDDRLSGIADYFLGRKWMTLGERNNFVNSENKLACLVSFLRRSFAPKSNADGKFDDVVNNFDVKQQELDADSQKAEKDIDVKNIHEEKMDDIGNDVMMPDKYDIVKENKKSDFRKDVQIGKPFEKQDVGLLHERKLDDIGDVSIAENIDIKKEFKPSDFKKDVIVDKIMKDEALDNTSITKETVLDDIDIDEPEEYDVLDDNLTELTKKDYKDDVKFDDVEEFTIDDIKDMKDDEFDYADLSKGDVDIDEMFDLDADKNEAEVDEVPEEVEISNKYDWSW